MIHSEHTFTAAAFAFWCYRNGFADVFEDDETSESRFNEAIINFHNSGSAEASSPASAKGAEATPPEGYKARGSSSRKEGGMIKCEDCLFWQLTDEATNEGECRKSAPRIYVSHQFCLKNSSFIMAPATEFPATNGDDWCGEFRPSETDVREKLERIYLKSSNGGPA